MEEKETAYNQGKGITETLSNLLGSYVLYMNEKNFRKATKIIRRMHDVISPKLQPEETIKIDKGIKEIEKVLPAAMEIYIYNNNSYIKNPELNSQVEKAIEEVFRFVNKLQDQYGFGMIDLEGGEDED